MTALSFFAAPHVRRVTVYDGLIGYLRGMGIIIAP